MTTPIDPATMAMLGQLLKQKSADPFAANRQAAAAIGANQPVGSEGQGFANLGSSAMKGVESMANAYAQREMNQQYVDQLTAALNKTPATPVMPGSGTGITY